MAVETPPAPTAGQQTIDGNEIPETVPQDGPLDEVRVKGTTQLGLLDAGGKSPTSSSLSLTGGKFDLMDGQAFSKGDTVVLKIVCVVDTVTQKDRTDRKVGVVVSCEQSHKAYITDAQVLEHS